MNSSAKNKVNWAAAIIAALIMVQTLFFKFAAAPESVYIFSTLGMEPWGRIGSGIAALIASILLLIPSVRLLGALLGIGVMAGAILSHLTVLGIEVMDVQGYLFALAVIVFVCCGICVLLNKAKIIQFSVHVLSSKKNHIIGS